MDDLQNLDADSIDSQVNSALGYSPKKTVQSATPKYSDFDVNKTYGTPARLLDNLNQIESSGNPYVVQKDTKAMGNYQFLPDTASMLNKQGIKFNAFDPKESRAASDYYIQLLVKQNGGDYNAAMSQYGGIKKTDPTQYLAKVMNGVDLGKQQIQQPQQPQVPQAQSNDPLNNLSGGSIDLAVQGAFNEGKKPPAPVKTFNPDADIPTDVGTAPTTAQPATNLPAYKQAFNKISADNKNNFASNYIKPAINNYLIPAAEPLITAASAIPAVGFGIKSMLTPQSKTQTDAEAAAWKAQNPSESFNPYEQKFIKGINEHIYQPRNLAAREVVSQAGDVLSQLPPIFPPELNALSSEGQVGKGKVAIKAEAPIATEITPSAEKAAQIASTDTPTYLRKQFAEKQAREQPTTVETAPIEITPQVATENTVKYNPSVGFTAAEYNAEKPLPKQEQMNRLEVLNRIDPNLTVDNNVVEGRGKDRSTDYDHSQKDTPLGNVLSEQFNKEKTSLNNYGEKLINNLGPAKDSEGLGTGGVGLDEASSYVRGKTALDYYQKLETHFDNAISKIYTERDSIAKDIPVNGQNIKHELTDPVTLNLGENAQLAKASTAKLQQLGMMDENGNMLPSNGYTAEQFRKWLNEPDVWDYKNRGLHKKLKDAVDADVISTLDTNTSIYKEARDLWGLKKDTLENPKGIASILDASGPNGINRKVDIEKITKSIETMGVDQFSRMIDTIDKAPPELQVQAQKAKAAIKSQFLNKMHEQFQKNANAGTKFLKENNEVMSRLFDHNEMEKINDYNAGAHILKTDTGYKGAATSFERANRGLLIGAAQEVIKKGAGLAAEAPFGGAAGGILGMMAHNKVSNYFEKGNLENLAQQKENLARQKKEGFTSLSSMNKPKTKTTNKSINFKANENQ